MTIPPRINRWFSLFVAAGTKYGVDPFILAAICDRESLGGDALKPPGPSGTGDHGHGRGLMQIDDRAHAEWIRSSDWADPQTNILKGAQVLSESIKTCSDQEAGIAGYNAGPGQARRVLKALGNNYKPEQKIKALDQITTGKNYVSDVLKRRDKFKLTVGA